MTKEEYLDQKIIEGMRKWKEERQKKEDDAIKDRKWLFDKIAKQIGCLYADKAGYTDEYKTESVDDPECAKRIIWERLSTINDSYKWDKVFQMIYNINLSSFDSDVASFLMKYRNFYGDDEQIQKLLKNGFLCAVEDALIMSVKVALLTICPSDVEFYETYTSDKFRYVEEFIIELLALEALNHHEESHKGGIFEDEDVKLIVESIRKEHPVSKIQN